MISSCNPTVYRNTKHVFPHFIFTLHAIVCTVDHLTSTVDTWVSNNGNSTVLPMFCKVWRERQL